MRTYHYYYVAAIIQRLRLLLLVVSAAVPLAKLSLKSSFVIMKCANIHDRAPFLVVGTADGHFCFVSVGSLQYGDRIIARSRITLTNFL
jgi:hypothetical protein